MAYSLDDAIYLIAIRSSGPKNGQEVREALEAIREHVEPVTNPIVAVKRADECGSPEHAALIQLGLTREHANSIVVVVGEDV